MRCLTTASASFGFALPVKTRIRSKAIAPPRFFAAAGGSTGRDPRAAVIGWGGRDRTYECRNQNPVPYHLATPQRNMNADGVNAPRVRHGPVSDDYANAYSG